jgi:hypothetical protein
MQRFVRHELAAFATAESTTFSITGVTSIPMPSPSTKGMIGVSGTFSEWSRLDVIGSPSVGTSI